MQHVLECVTQLSAMLGLKTNPSKTHVYRWAPPSRREAVARRESPTRGAITWGDARLRLQPPIFHYLGHLLAHPTWEQKARDDFVGTTAPDLARYQYLPLNAFQRVQLLNTVLIPRWTYRTLFLPNDSMFKAMDSMCLRFVLMAEGMTSIRSTFTNHTTSSMSPPLTAWAEWGYTNCSRPTEHASPQWYKTHYAHVRDPLVATLAKNCPPDQCLFATTWLYSPSWVLAPHFT